MEAQTVTGRRSPGTNGFDARARRVAFLSFERRRSRVASNLNHLQLPRRRYADLCLAARLGRAEFDYVGHDVPHERNLPSTDQCLNAGLDYQLMETQRSLERMERWLPPIARRKAEADAEERFRAIAGQVAAELESQGLDASSVVPAAAPSPEPVEETPAPVAAPSPEPVEEKPTPAAAPAREPVATPGRCQALTRQGRRCRNRVKAGVLCSVHARMKAAIGEASADEPSVEEGPPRTTPPATKPPATKLPLSVIPAVPRATALGAGASAALVAAVLLIWSGLSDGEGAPLGPGVAVSAPVERSPIPPLDRTGGDRDRTAAPAALGAATGDQLSHGRRAGEAEPAGAPAVTSAPTAAAPEPLDSGAGPGTAPAPSEPAPPPATEPGPVIPDPPAAPVPDDTAPEIVDDVVGGVAGVAQELPRAPSIPPPPPVPALV